MAFREMSRADVDRLLAAERLVHVAFDAAGERYLVPLGFVWHRDALWAMTSPGRKTRMAAANPRVSFQVDTSARTGNFVWQSVSGEGTVEVVSDPGELATVARLLESRFPDMPDWMRAEHAERRARGDVVYVRIRPSRLAGRRSDPPGS
jgi:nitroimidazol reductase NimA-like FMN-containing flavoprotein (pyridoxamine 5'-phosphate oxidase superfamily)